MKKLTTILACTAMTAIGVNAASAQERWTMTSTWTDSLKLIQFDRHWVEMVNQLQDEVEINFFEGGTIVPTSEVFGAVQGGQVQASGDWPGYWAGRSPAFSALATHTSLFNANDFINWIEGWGGREFYNELYGEYGLVYIPYAISSSESGFRTNTPIASLDDLQGKRLRLSGLDQGKVLERLGGNQVSMAGQEIYQALERGVIDGSEFSIPIADLEAGFDEVTSNWSTPGWHQSSSVYGVMINQDAWDALSEETQRAFEIAAMANITWSLATTERQNSEATQSFTDAGIEINKLSDEALQQIQETTNEVIVESACADPMAARIFASQIRYLNEYASWREASAPYNLGRNPDVPDIEAIEACVESE